MLEIFKDKIILDSFMQTIEVNNPQILFLLNMSQPKKIRLEKEKKVLAIYYKNKVDVWNLTN